MAEEQESSPSGQRGLERRHDFFRALGRDWQRESPQPQPLALGGPLPAPLHRPVFMVGEQDFPGRRQLQCRRRHIDRSGDVRGKDEAARIATEKMGESFAGFPQQRRHLADEEIHRLFGQPAAQFGGPVKDCARQWTERTCVEIGNGRVEQHLRPSASP